MIPIDQTILEPPLGNCYAACLASIFEVSLEEVPQVRIQEQGVEGWNDLYMPRVNRDFVNPRGFHLLTDLDATRGWKPPGYSILGAYSPRFEGKLHAVVCLDGEIVFDPHPEREMGVKDWHVFDIFLVLNPALSLGNL